MVAEKFEKVSKMKLPSSSKLANFKPCFYSNGASIGFVSVAR